MDTNKKQLEAAAVLACGNDVVLELGLRSFEMAIAVITVGKNKFFKITEISICWMQYHHAHTQSYRRIWGENFICAS